MRYTAREGGEILKEKAVESLTNDLAAASAEVSLVRAFSAKQEFPSEWHQFLHPNVEASHHSLDLDLSEKRFPFQFRDRTIEIKSMHLFLKLKEEFEYEDAKPLSLLLKNPDRNRSYATPDAKNLDPGFKVASSLIENLPCIAAFKDKNEKPGTWSVEVPGFKKKDARGEIPKRLSHPKNSLALNPDAIDNLIVVCHYSVQ